MRQQHSQRIPEPKWRGWRIPIGVACFLLIAATGGVVWAEDWATYRGDVHRSGVTRETVGPALFEQWTYTPLHAPKPAWPMPAEELPRTHVDNAYHVAIAKGTVYLGSSVTNRVSAFDAASGKMRWTFSTEGPVRFAPTVHKGRLYAGSDDGYVYCLNAKNGKLIWKYRAGPSDEKVLGNGRMISLWPVRTSVLVDGGQVLFCAGVFPYEGLYICALDPGDGSVLWRNDTIGDRAHELEYGGISPQGYLLASKDVLYVPSGRAMPAAFDRSDGSFLFSASPGAKRGGTWAMLDGDRLIAGVDHSGVPAKVAYNAATGKSRGDVFAWFPGVDMVLAGNVAYVVTKEGLFALDRSKHAEASKGAAQLSNEREGLSGEMRTLASRYARADQEARPPIKKRMDEISAKAKEVGEEIRRRKESATVWRYSRKGLCSSILAGSVLYVGGQGVVLGLDAQTGALLWQEEVAGTAVGLAASDGRLIVSTDTGAVHCYGEKKVSQPGGLRATVTATPYPEDASAGLYESAAEKIIERTGSDKGYCLVLDCGEGRLAYELAKRTQLQIIGIEKDPAKLETARRNLDAAGLLGSRVVVEPWDLSDLPEYFANLTVSDGMLQSGRSAASADEWSRLLRPWGGTAMLGAPDGTTIAWNIETRGALEGAGSWTHQYANPENTACSGDELVNGPLGILWFGEPGPQGMVERHGRSQSPVSIAGRLFVEGEERIMAIDAYNGTLLWEREIPGAVRVKTKGDSGNLAATPDGLYVAAHEKCYRLDPATGETIRVYEVPPSPDNASRRWGYVSVVGKILYGSAAIPMRDEYAGFWKAAVADGKWKAEDEIPARHQRTYRSYRAQYPEAGDELWWALQRSGNLYRPMASFARGGEFLQKNAVTSGLMASDAIFAMDTETGALLWIERGERIANVTVSFGDGKIFFADSATSGKQRKRALDERRQLIKTGSFKEREGVLDELRAKKAERAALRESGRQFNADRINYEIDSLASELFKEDFEEGILDAEDADVRLVVALDAATGAKLWEKPYDLTGCGGDKMGSAYRDGLLLFFGNHGNHDAWRFREGNLKWRRITTLSAENGDLAWSKPLNYRTRPVIVGDRIIIEPRACDLYTGEIITRTHPITGEEVPWEFLRPGHTCAITAASATGLFYRSASTAFYDLEKDRGVTVFGAYRPGCAISVIPASGVLLSPEASAGCTCSYPIRGSIALVRKPKRTQPWTVFISSGPIRPVERFAINFGAVADMKDDAGTVWFGYPNPDTRRFNHFPNYGIKFDLNEEIIEGMGYFSQDHKALTIAGADRPWLFTSGCRGLVRCTVPLIDDAAGQGPATYSVRLGFSAPAGDRPRQRTFGIRIQGRLLLDDFDIVQAAGKAEKAVVKEFNGIRVENDLLIELVPTVSRPKPGQAPIVNFIEIIRDGPKSTKVAAAS